MHPETESFARIPVAWETGDEPQTVAITRKPAPAERPPPRRLPQSFEEWIEQNDAPPFPLSV